MRVTIASRVGKEFRKIPKFDQITIAQKIRSFTTERVSGEEKVSGFSRAYRVRVGSYRIVYQKYADGIDIVLISHRKDVYRLLKELLR